MTSIVPSGNSLNEFPTAYNTPEQLAVRQAYIAIQSYENTLKALMNRAEQILKNYAPFFASHFGLDPMKGIKEHYYPKITSPPSQSDILAKANEIAVYENPSAKDYNLNVESIAAVLSAIAKAPEYTSKINSAKAEAAKYVNDAIFLLNSRPTAQSIKMFVVPQNPILKTKDMYKPGSVSTLLKHWTKGNATMLVAETLFGYKGSNYTRTGGLYLMGGSNYMSWTKVDGTITYWTEPILQYYFSAYNTTPEAFWKFSYNHRLGVERDPSSGKYFAMLHKVDPGTGAPTGSMVPVAMADTTDPSTFLSTVKTKMFPEMYLLNQGVNIGSDERKQFYTEQLKAAEAMWTGIPDKANTQYAVVIQQGFRYPKAAIPNGQWAISSPKKNITTAPVTTLKIYLQPAGLEAAMEKMFNLDTQQKGGNTIKSMLLSQIPDWKQEENSNIYTTDKINNYSSVGGINYFKRQFEGIVNMCYRFASHPFTLMFGSEYWMNPLNVNSAQQRELIFGSDMIKRMGLTDYAEMTRIYEAWGNGMAYYSNWPEAKPQLIFSAPIDDEADAVELVKMFNAHMSTLPSPPAQLMVPETWNGSITYQTYVDPNDNNNTLYKFNIQRGNQYPYRWPDYGTVFYGKSIDTRTSGTTIYEPYAASTKTIVTQKSVSNNVNIDMSIPITVTYQQPVGSATPQPISPDDTTMALNLVAGSAVIAGVVGGVMWIRNQSR